MPRPKLHPDLNPDRPNDARHVTIMPWDSRSWAIMVQCSLWGMAKKYKAHRNDPSYLMTTFHMVCRCDSKPAALKTGRAIAKVLQVPFEA